MKYELRIVHDSFVARSLKEWSSDGRIEGYTTTSVHQSFGCKEGRFRADSIVGEKFLTSIYFKGSQKKVALEIKKEMEEQEFFVTLMEIQCL